MYYNLFGVTVDCYHACYSVSLHSPHGIVTVIVTVHCFCYFFFTISCHRKLLQGVLSVTVTVSCYIAPSAHTELSRLCCSEDLSLVSFSVDAARQPSAFIAHLAHTHSDIYMAATACKHRRTCLSSDHNRRPCVCVSTSEALLEEPPVSELTF